LCPFLSYPTPLPPGPHHRPGGWCCAFPSIGIPVFSIHGNHDDPAGDGNLCALDLLSVANFVNYFGKATSIDDITVTPILIQKGAGALLMYSWWTVWQRLADGLAEAGGRSGNVRQALAADRRKMMQQTDVASAHRTLALLRHFLARCSLFAGCWAPAWFRLSPGLRMPRSGARQSCFLCLVLAVLAPACAPLITADRMRRRDKAGPLRSWLDPG